MKPELDTFYALIDDIEIAMMTTRRPDGHLESRAMANQKPAAGADLWFVTAEGTAKLRDLDGDPHLNLAYYKDRTREWISVSGARDHVPQPAEDSRAVRARLEDVVLRQWRSAAGTPDDPRLVLIGVDVQAAVFWKWTSPVRLCCTSSRRDGSQARCLISARCIGWTSRIVASQPAVLERSSRSPV